MGGEPSLYIILFSTTDLTFRILFPKIWEIGATLGEGRYPVSSRLFRGKLNFNDEMKKCSE
jgi:hypothetical protein